MTHNGSRIRFDPALPISARRDDIRTAIERHPVVIVCGETGSGKTTQLPKILLEMGRGAGRPHRPHAAAAHRRALGRRAHRRGAEGRPRRPGRLQGALPRPGRQPHTAIKLMTDGILLAETQGDPQLRALRHDHPRRGARAQPEHRFPARLPQEAAAEAGRPEGDHHLRHDRRRALLEALRRRAGDRGLGAAVSRSRCATARWAATPRTRRATRRSRRSPTRWRSCAARARATCWCSCPASARSAMPRTCWRRRIAAGAEILPLYSPPVRGRAGPRVPARAARGAWCSPPTSPRPRSPCRASATWSTPAQARVKRYSYRNKVEMLRVETDLAGGGAAARRPLRPRGERRLHPPLLRGGLRAAARRSPIRSCCARRSPR